MKRTQQQIINANAKTVELIDFIFKSHKLLNEWGIITTNKLTEKQIETIFKKSCKKFGTNINHTKTIKYGKQNLLASGDK